MRTIEDFNNIYSITDGKKVKEKKGSVIAYINKESLLEISAVTNTWDESWEIDTAVEENTRREISKKSI